jgi:hypothetical protein
MCDHDVVVRVERIPPQRQPGPYVRWFCGEPECGQEFVPVKPVGRFRLWHEANKLRYQLGRWEEEQQRAHEPTRAELEDLFRAGP